jgi:transcriptional regulator GlxA family with amidase domain
VTAVRIAIVTLDGFNEIDSLVALHLLNRMRPYGWRAEIVGPAHTVTSMNGLVIHTQRPLATAAAADVVIFGSGVGGRQAARDHTLRDQLPVDPQRQLIAAQCSGVLLMGALGLLDGLAVCTDHATRPWVINAGMAVLDQPFVAYGQRATAGGCLAAVHLSAWVVATLAGREHAADMLASVAPVGDSEFVEAILRDVDPFLDPARLTAETTTGEGR